MFFQNSISKWNIAFLALSMAKLFVSDLVNTDDAVFLPRKLVVEAQVALPLPLVVPLLEELQKSKSSKYLNLMMSSAVESNK